MRSVAVTHGEVGEQHPALRAAAAIATVASWPRRPGPGRIPTLQTDRLNGLLPGVLSLYRDIASSLDSAVRARL
jgi:hypothetical protein